MYSQKQRKVKKYISLLLGLCIAVTPLVVFANTNAQLQPNGSQPYDNGRRWQASSTVASVSTPDIPWEPMELPPRQLGIIVQGYVPWILPAFENSYYLINERIEDIVGAIIADARRTRARSINFSFEVHPTQDMVSVLVRAQVTSVITRTLVRSVNFCPTSGALLTIRDATAVNLVPLASRILTDRMRRYPEQFYAVQNVSLYNQAFFVTTHGVTFLFDEFQLSSMVGGVVPLELRNEHVFTATLRHDQLLPYDHAYDLMMVPLGYVASQLGYTAIWNEELRRAEVSTGNTLLVWMYTGINEYRTQDLVRTLEAAPHITENNQMYVPITFFERVLPLSTYNIDEFGNITFLAYMG